MGMRCQNNSHASRYALSFLFSRAGWLVLSILPVLPSLLATNALADGVPASHEAKLHMILEQEKAEQEKRDKENFEKAHTARQRSVAYRREMTRMAAGLLPDPMTFQKIEVLFGSQVYFLPLPAEIESSECEHSDGSDESFELKCKTDLGLLSLTFKIWEPSIMEAMNRGVTSEFRPSRRYSTHWHCHYVAHDNSSLLRHTSECTSIERDPAKENVHLRTWIQPRDSRYTVLISIQGKEYAFEAIKMLSGAIAYGTGVFASEGTPREAELMKFRSKDIAARFGNGSINLGRKLASAPIRPTEVAEQGSPLAESHPHRDSSLPSEIEFAGQTLKLLSNRVLRDAIVHAEYGLEEENGRFWTKRLIVRFWKNSLLSPGDYAGEIASTHEARMANGDIHTNYEISRGKNGKSVFLNVSFAEKEKNRRYVEYQTFRAFRTANGLVSFEWATRVFAPETLKGDEQVKDFLKQNRAETRAREKLLVEEKIPLPELSRKGVDLTQRSFTSAPRVLG